MESLPLHHSTVHKWLAIINRSHTLLHSIGLTAIIYYRLSSFLHHKDSIAIPLLPWLIVFCSELLLSFLWLLNTAYGWRPISRTVFPERLPADEELPAIDIFICTADPEKEPPAGVMNTVLSVMALDYPPEKLSVYLSDDAGSSLTLFAMREARVFAKSWLPFCRRYGVKTSCPEAYFSLSEDSDGDHDCGGGDDFRADREKIERMYEQFKEQLKKAGENTELRDSNINMDHPQVVEVIQDSITDFDRSKLPLFVYVSREKRPSHQHHFKAGALNILLRVSGIISNAPYILVLDCDMYSNDPTSARQAMCFHLDQAISPTLAFVQFPQKFHNLSKNDIYDGGLRSVFVIKWPGMDGLRGPMLSGTCFYIKRKALYGNHMPKGMDVLHLKQTFGPSNEFIKSVSRGYKNITIGNEEALNAGIQESKFLACCTFEKDTHWGKQIGFLYNSLVEDYFTGFRLHCKGWTSAFCNPSRPAFLGTATTNLNDTLVQGTRWNLGLIQVCFSRFCPIVYGLPRMDLLQCMCYAYLAFQPFYSFPVWCLATIPQLCLLNGIPVYPKVSSVWFIVFSFIFLSALIKYLMDVLSSGGEIQTWWNEWRVWTIKSVTAYFYGSLNAILGMVGIKEATFLPTNKVADDEQFKRYQMGVYDFQTSTMLLAPLVTLVVINMVSFQWGVLRLVVVGGGGGQMFGQVFLSLFVLAVNYPLVEGMIFRKDKGRVPPFVTLLSVGFSVIFFSLGSVFFSCT